MSPRGPASNDPPPTTDPNASIPRSTDSPLPPQSLVKALSHLLRPLVRLLLVNQITYPVLAQLLKPVYLETADREFAQDGKPATASRLSLTTGLHRKDIKRLREEPRLAYAVPAAVSLGARLVLRWTETPEYCDASGTPLPLPRLHAQQERAESPPSFESLVSSVSTDIRPRAVLDEWLRLGVARLDEEDRVHLLAEGFVPRSGFDEKAHFFGRNLHDHIAAGAHNLIGGGPPLLERSVHYDGLSAESVETLRALAEELGIKTLKTLNRRALALRRRDTRGSDRSERMNFGIYFLRDSAPHSADEEEASDDAQS